MKTSVIEVSDMLSVLSVHGVEDRIGEVPGVESVTVNFSVGNATVRYDETRLDVSDIKSAVRQRGYDEAAAPASPPGAADSKPAAPKPAKPAEPAEPVSAGADASGAKGAKPPAKAAQPAAPAPVQPAGAADHAAPSGGEKMAMTGKAMDEMPGAPASK